MYMIECVKLHLLKKKPWLASYYVATSCQVTSLPSMNALYKYEKAHLCNALSTSVYFISIHRYLKHGFHGSIATDGSALP